MPSVPGFAGDLHADDSLGTRAIIQYQYKSICRGGYSIMEAIEQAGVPNAMEYIRFYNLRNYDRINANATMRRGEHYSGASYARARREHDDIVGTGYGRRGQMNEEYYRYQEAAGVEFGAGNEYDTVSQCYMDGGVSIKDVPWSCSPDAEMDAFVSEELYIHSKILIADDRVVMFVFPVSFPSYPTLFREL
jgi:phospholipase D1/2